MVQRCTHCGGTIVEDGAYHEGQREQYFKCLQCGREPEEMRFFKVLGKGGVSCNGGSGEWFLPKNGKPGKWMPKIKDIIPCRSGYHLCRAEDLIQWLNEEVYLAEGRGKSIRHDNSKDVFEQARLIRKIGTWNDKTARLFAADCAEHVLHNFEKKCPNDQRPRLAIQAARDFANGKIRASAWDAAWAAAWDAAWAAAWDAAWDAAGAAAGAAARAAAWDAAWDAERKWQIERLFCYLEIPYGE